MSALTTDTVARNSTNLILHSCMPRKIKLAALFGRVQCVGAGKERELQGHRFGPAGHAKSHVSRRPSAIVLTVLALICNISPDHHGILLRFHYLTQHDPASTIISTRRRMSRFIPRQSYPHLSSIPRSYFLGHHAAGLSKMRAVLSSIDLVVECRDYRTPLSSRNPLFEENLGDRPRLIVYTKQDLGSRGTTIDIERETIIRKWDYPSTSLFTNIKSRNAISQVLDFARSHSQASQSLFGTRLMVVGMPNVGKSSLLNALRNVSLGKKKAARTGDQPGVTRKIGTSVKIIEGDSDNQNVYVLDTPGVFIPYVADAESMLKLALCGNVKESFVAPLDMADYLLYHLNLQNPKLYDMYSKPTNEILVVLEALARKQGRLKKGGVPDFEASAIQFVQRWRAGEMGKFVLDTVTDDALVSRRERVEALGGSINQARKAVKRLRKEAYINAG